MKIKFWGTRGSIPVPGNSTLKYGGNTPCIEVLTSNDRVIILDAGTGIRELGNCLINEKARYRKIDILISHSHFDHIQGLPFFSPFYRNDFEINIYASVEGNVKTEFIIDSQMQPFFFPVNRDVFNAKLNFYRVSENSLFEIDGIVIQTSKVNHSKGTLSFKLSDGNKSLVYMTDNEIMFRILSSDPIVNKIQQLNSGIISFCQDADYLIHDCMYNKISFSNKLGWGHSNNVSLAYFAMIAKVKNLILFHYDPDYSDFLVDEMYLETKEIISGSKWPTNCIAAFEGLEFNC